MAGYFTKYFTKYFQIPGGFDPLDAGPDEKKRRKRPENEEEPWQWQWSASPGTTATFGSPVVQDAFDDEEDEIIALLLLG